MSLQIFLPDLRVFRRDVAITTVAYLVGAPLLYAWKFPKLPLAWGAGGLLLGLLLIVGPAIWRARGRRFDTIGIDAEGILVTRPRGGFRVAWQEVARVYRFQETLVVETLAPVRRETIHLQGHEDHEDEMFAAMAEHARTLNLSILDSLARLGGAAR